jgi:hypothetical protein
LAEIRDLLQQDQLQHNNEVDKAAALQATLHALKSLYSPRAIMDALAQCLFRDDSEMAMDIKEQGDDDGGGVDDGHPLVFLSSRDALAVLGCLVATDASRYLVEASQAVSDEAIRLTTSVETMVVSPELLAVIVQQLSVPNVSVSTHATSALVACCRKLGTQLRIQAIDSIVEAWKRHYYPTSTSNGNRNQASTIAFRCAAALVEILCLEEGTQRDTSDLASTSSSKVFLTMLTDESDPLVQVSTIDLLERMASSRPMHHWRAHWLLSWPVLDPVLRLCGGAAEGSSPDPVLGAPALRLVTCLCRAAHCDDHLAELGATSHEVLRGFHTALHNYQASTGGGGETDRLALVDAIASFASASSEALDMVLSDPVTRRAWLSLSVAQPKLKAVVLYSVATVLDPHRTACQVVSNSKPFAAASAPPSNELGMKLFSQLGQVNDDEATNLVLSLVRSPLPETRLACYALLRAVASSLPTGGQLLFTHPDFADLLLNRESTHFRETTKEGREAKWELVRAVQASPVAGLLAEDIVRAMDRYVKQGPHYVKVQQWELVAD